MKWHYFLILTIVLLSSCIPEEPPIEEDPKAKGIYECFIDGEEYKAFGPNFANQWSPNPHASLSELSGSFKFSISNWTLNEYFYFVTYEKVKTPGYYKLDRRTEYTKYSDIKCDNYLKYSLANDQDYFINVEEVDMEFDIIVASFSFVLINECVSDTLTVEGSFDLEYSL